MKDIELTSQEWCDIVFEGKNKKYGAYYLRRSTSKRFVISLIAVLAFVILVAFTPKLIKTVAEITRKPSEGLTESTVLAELKDVEEQVADEIIQQQEALPPPPLKSTIKFTAPVITSSDEMTEEDMMKSQDELASTKLQISIADVQGTDDESGVDIADLKEHKEIVQEKEEIFHVADQMPAFPGGEKELYKFLQNNIVYPSSAKENMIEGTVLLEFVVNSEGNVDRIKVLVDPYPTLSKEAVRVVKLMPKWIPGKRNGVNVSTYYTLPVNFRIY